MFDTEWLEKLTEGEFIKLEIFTRAIIDKEPHDKINKDYYVASKSGDLLEMSAIEASLNPNVVIIDKPKTIRIGEFDVPEPIRIKPNNNDVYYAVNFNRECKVSCHKWYDFEVENSLLSSGLIHITKEAAEIHANALISLTELKK